jgi:hypothetical protein
MKLIAVIVLILVLLTVGCGFAIRYGGSQFKNAIGGHMVLGVLSLISIVVLAIYVFVKR